MSQYRLQSKTVTMGAGLVAPMEFSHPFIPYAAFDTYGNPLSLLGAFHLVKENFAVTLVPFGIDKLLLTQFPIMSISTPDLSNFDLAALEIPSGTYGLHSNGNAGYTTPPYTFFYLQKI